jgi:transposase
VQAQAEAEDEAAVAQAVRRQASFLVATNVLDPTQLADHELIQTYKHQHSVERGFAFLKDPLFLASSVFVKKPFSTKNGFAREVVESDIFTISATLLLVTGAPFWLAMP